MKILVIDACGSFCGVAFWMDGRVVSLAYEKMERGQDARLMTMILGVMAEAGSNFFALDKIAVTRGPGSFTGVRVGLATARGIGIASGKPVIGLDRFSIYKAMYDNHRDLLVVIQSKRAELFCQFFPAQKAPHDACMMTQQEIDKFLTVHADAEMILDEKADEQQVLTVCAGLAAEHNAESAESRATPLYLRLPDAIPNIKAV